MLITKETDYALRILRALAGGERLATADIAKNEQVPQAFAYKIIKKLQKAGIVTIHRGSDGGCALTKDLSTISLFALLQSMDEDPSLSACMRTGHQCQWQKAHSGRICHAHIRLGAIQDTLNRELENQNLQEILFGS